MFLVTALFSLFAYVWLLVVLEFSSPNVVESWEAALTFLFFPMLVGIAYAADQNWKCGKKTKVTTAEEDDQHIEMGVGNGIGNGDECKW